MDYKYIVYLTVNKCNGKFYIGVHKTINPSIFDGYIGNGIARPSSAVYLQKINNQRKHKIPFVDAVVKYGYSNFIRTTLKIFDREEDAYTFEAEIVNENLIRCKHCYNIALGGKIRFNTIERKVYQFSLDGNFLRSYKSIRDASRVTGCNDANIHAVLTGKQCHCGGFFWNTEKVFDYKELKKTKAICQYDFSGKFIAAFDSIKEAKELYHTTSINRAIKNESSAVGYQWRYYEGNYNNIAPYTINYNNKNNRQNDDIV